MLSPSYYTKPTEIDLMVYEKMIPEDHILCQFKKVIKFEQIRDLVKDCYHPNLGRSAEDPVIMLKLEVLQYLDGLSDRKVLKEVQVNVAYRYFLDLSMDSPLPSIGLLSQFRRRLGDERHQTVFGEVIRQARQHGLIKDDLRLTDVTHVIANVAVPATAEKRQTVCPRTSRGRTKAGGGNSQDHSQAHRDRTAGSAGGTFAEDRGVGR